MDIFKRNIYIYYHCYFQSVLGCHHVTVYKLASNQTDSIRMSHWRPNHYIIQGKPPPSPYHPPVMPNLATKPKG